MEQITYEESFGRIHWPDGFKEELEGKTIEEQLQCYGISTVYRNPMSYHIINEKAVCRPLTENETRQIIVKDGLVVGIKYGEKICLPYSLLFYDYDCDNNGAGYKESYTNYYLICVPYNICRPVITEPPFGAPIHEITVPVTEIEDDITPEYPEGFLDQIAGKSLAEQLDYFRITKRGRQSYIPNPASVYYDFYWGNGMYGTLLRYSEELSGIMTKDGVIAGVKMTYSYPEWSFEKTYTLMLGDEPLHIYEFFGVKDGIDYILHDDPVLQALVYPAAE